MIGFIKITLTDLPGAMLPGGSIQLVLPGDPVPDGLNTTEVVTAKEWQLTTGEDTFSRKRTIQKVAYHRYRLKLFARPSDNVDLMQFANRFQIELPSGDVHFAELLEYSPTQAAGTAVRQIDVVYVDTNAANYPGEPANEWLTHSALNAKITAGTLNAIKCTRLRFAYGGTTLQWYTILHPEIYLSEPQYPEDDTAEGVAKPNAVQATDRVKIVFYASETVKNQIYNNLILYGSTDTAVTTLFFPASPQTVLVAIERPQVTVEQVEGARDLWAVTVDFATESHYTINYNA